MTTPNIARRWSIFNWQDPSRAHLPEYQRLKQDVEALVRNANQKFGTSNWTPIDYRYESLPQEQLAQLYQDADVALVTPICDGMNLIAKEDVACQVECGGVPYCRGPLAPRKRCSKR